MVALYYGFRARDSRRAQAAAPARKAPSADDLWLRQSIVELDAAEGRVGCRVRCAEPAADAWRDQLWLLDRRDNTPMRPLTSAHAAIASPRLSPDGRWLACVVTDGDAWPRLRCLRLDDGGEAPEWLPAIDGEVSGLAWCEAATLLVSTRAGRLLRIEPAHQRLHALELRPAIALEALDAARDGSGLAGLHDGVLWWCRVADGHLHAHPMAAAVSARPRWSADARRIAVVASREGRPGLWSLDVASGGAQQVGPPGLTPLTSAAPLWSAAGTHLHLLARHDGLERALTVDADGSLPLGPADHAAGGLARDGDELLAALESPAAAPELHVLRATQAPCPLTRLNDWWNDRVQPRVERRCFDTAAGGRVHGWWVHGSAGRPADGRCLVEPRRASRAPAQFDLAARAHWPVLAHRGWSILALDLDADLNADEAMALQRSALDALLDEGEIDGRTAWLDDGPALPRSPRAAVAWVRERVGRAEAQAGRTQRLQPA
jgi:hypothetical protein